MLRDHQGTSICRTIKTGWNWSQNDMSLHMCMSLLKMFVSSRARIKNIRHHNESLSSYRQTCWENWSWIALVLTINIPSPTETAFHTHYSLFLFRHRWIWIWYQASVIWTLESWNLSQDRICSAQKFPLTSWSCLSILMSLPLAPHLGDIVGVRSLVQTNQIFDCGVSFPATANAVAHSQQAAP